VPVQTVNNDSDDETPLADLKSDDWIVDSLLGTGEVVVAHIGIPLTWLQEWLLIHRTANATDDLS